MKIKNKILSLIFASSIFISSSINVFAENKEYTLPESFTFNYYLGKIVRRDFKKDDSSGKNSSSQDFDNTISKDKFNKEYDKVKKAITSFYKSNSSFNSLSENDKLRDMESFIDYQFNSKTPFEPNSYDIQIAYNYYKTAMFLKEGRNKNMQAPIRKQDIDFIINNYDKFRKYVNYLDDYDFCNWVYSITTKVDNYGENANNPWKDELIKKNNIFKSFFANENKHLVSKEENKTSSNKETIANEKKYSQYSAYYKKYYDYVYFLLQSLNFDASIKIPTFTLCLYFAYTIK